MASNSSTKLQAEFLKWPENGIFKPFIKTISKFLLTRLHLKFDSEFKRDISKEIHFVTRLMHIFIHIQNTHWDFTLLSICHKNPSIKCALKTAATVLTILTSHSHVCWTFLPVEEVEDATDDFWADLLIICWAFWASFTRNWPSDPMSGPSSSCWFWVEREQRPISDTFSSNWAFNREISSSLKRGFSSWAKNCKILTIVTA